MGAQFFLVGERKNVCTDITKLTVTFRNFANVPKKFTSSTVFRN